MNTPHEYWFPAKRLGWGWSLPRAWQGWLVLALFFVALFAGSVFLLPNLGKGAFVIYCALLCAILIGVCWLKGEPPRWRGGGGGGI